MTREEYLRRGAEITFQEILREVVRFLEENMMISFKNASYSRYTFDFQKDNPTEGSGHLAITRDTQYAVNVLSTMNLGNGSILRFHEWERAKILVDVPESGKYQFLCTRTETDIRLKFLGIQQK